MLPIVILLDTSDSHYNLGLLYRLNGDPHDARASFKLARDVRVDCFGENALEVAEVDVSAGFTDHQLGRLEDARKHYEHAYLVRKHHLSDVHPDTEEALSLLKAVRESLGMSNSRMDLDELQLSFNLSQMTSNSKTVLSSFGTSSTQPNYDQYEENKMTYSIDSNDNILS